jgi:H+/Cl- antiporter ClcA
MTPVAADPGRALAQGLDSSPIQPTTHRGMKPVAYNPGMSWVTVYGVAALTFMMVMYWLEHRGPVFVPGFALGCLLSSIYGFLAGAWPFGVLEAVWCLIAIRRYATRRAGRGEVPA